MMNDKTTEPTPIIHVQTNYDVWSQIMEMQIAGREKLEYIMGKTQPPQEADVSY